MTLKTEGMNNLYADYAAGMIGRDRFLTALQREYWTTFVGFCQHYVGDYDTAEDMAAQTFYRVYRKVNQRIDHFSAWMHKISENLCLTELRRRKRWQKTPLDVLNIPEYSDGKTPETLFEKGQIQYAVHNAMDRLPPAFREVVEYGLHKMPYKDILGDTPLGTMKSRAFRGRERMREALLPLAMDYGIGRN